MLLAPTLPPLARQILSLSSGTIASLTGWTRYDDIDAFQQDWVAWAEQHDADVTGSTWQTAWSAFQGAGFPGAAMPPRVATAQRLPLRSRAPQPHGAPA